MQYHLSIVTLEIIVVYMLIVGTIRFHENLDFAAAVTNTLYSQ